MKYDLINQLFGSLTVVSEGGFLNGDRAWNCLCECGTIKVVRAKALKSGQTSSCGCKMGAWKHGMNKHPLYATWNMMIQRCDNPNATSYADYGGRGIKVCPEWYDIHNFIKDMSPKPDNTQLDRKDNELGYSKDNCMWSTNKENSINRRNVVTVEYMGEVMPLMRASELSGIPYHRLWQRIKNGTKDVFKK